MNELLLFVLWILITLSVSTSACIMGVRYGSSFPISIMGALVTIAAVAANKIVMVGPLAVPGGIIVASTTFLITDILSEIWGKATAQKAVWAGFFGLILMVISLSIVSVWPAAPFAMDRAAMFHEVLGLTPRIVLASIVAYLFSQHHDVWAFDLWKAKFQGKHLWLRNNASTIASQLIDSVIFITIAFYGVMPIGQMILNMWLVKIAIALLDTPFIYFVRWITIKAQQRESFAY